jgi:hypothetical protein
LVLAVQAIEINKPSITIERFLIIAPYICSNGAF